MSSRIVLLVFGLLGFSVAVPLDQPYNPQDFFISRPRILNGTDAPEGSAPHMAALLIGNIVPSFMCGASIIRCNMILTAAHCIDAMKGWDGHLLDSSRGVIGTNRWFDERNIVKFSGYKNHPEWNPFTIKYDVGLLFTADKLKLSEGVALIAMNFKFIGGGHPVSVTGWGTTSLWGSIPDKLQLLVKETISPQQCEEEIRKAQQQWGPSPQVDSAVEICTIHKLGAGNGVCHGDSGSPLLDEMGELIGLVSWGFPCGHVPDMSARISGFKEFFMSILGPKLGELQENMID